MTRRVVVTGATGFLGRHVVPELLRNGFEVQTLGRSTPPDHRVVHHPIDLLCMESADELFARIRPSHFLHLAWIADPKSYHTSPENMRWLEVSLTLLRSFKKFGGKRLVVSGSCAEYEWKGDSPFVEGISKIEPATPYGICKAALHCFAAVYAKESDLSVAWAYLFHLYGPHEKRGRLVSDAVTALLSGEEFATSADQQRRDFMHVADASRAIVDVLMSDVQGPINIATGHASTVRSILDLIAAETKTKGLVKFKARTAPAINPDLVGASVEILHRETGFSPTYTLESGIADTVNWWRAQKTLIEISC